MLRIDLVGICSYLSQALLHGKEEFSPRVLKQILARGRKKSKKKKYFEAARLVGRKGRPRRTEKSMEGKKNLLLFGFFIIALP